MNCWLNIHYPPPEGEPQPCYVYLQRKNKHFISEFNIEDIAFIYQTLTSPTKVKITDKNGSRWRKLTKGKGGIIAVVKITSNFIEDAESDYYPVDNGRQIDYIGYFVTERIKVKRQFASLQTVREPLPHFNPRINGGLRKLKFEECKTLNNLMGYSEEGAT